MNNEESFITGFVKRAMEYGYSEEEAFCIYKQAGPVIPKQVIRKPVPAPVTAPAPAPAPAMSEAKRQAYQDAEQFRKIYGLPSVPLNQNTGVATGGYTPEQMAQARNELGANLPPLKPRLRPR